MQASPVKQAAQKAGVPVLQPEHLKSAEIQQQLRELQADLMIVVAYGLILPQAVLDIPRLGCWNIHASLLPRWRGAAPIQRAIEAGDRESGICIMQMDAGLDTGDVLARVSTPLAENETGGSLHDRLAILGAQQLLTCLEQVRTERLPAAIPQDAEGMSYARKLDKSEARMDWQQSADLLERKVRAFNPWPVCWCEIDGERSRIWQAKPEAQAQTTAQTPEGTSAPGTVISACDEGIVVACGSGRLRILQLQRAGGKPVSAREYLQSSPLTPYVSVIT
jgi:methionyl-tRNA formyltransferase